MSKNNSDSDFAGRYMEFYEERINDSEKREEYLEKRIEELEKLYEEEFEESRRWQKLYVNLEEKIKNLVEKISEHEIKNPQK